VYSVPTYVKERLPKYLKIIHRWCALKEMDYYYDGQARGDEMSGIRV
jgi:hypothetical protein